MGSSEIEVVSILFWILFGFGVLLALVGVILLLVQAFKESVAWGLCAIFIPFALLIFVFTHWNNAKAPFGVWIAGVFLVAGSVIFQGEEAIESENEEVGFKQIEQILGTSDRVVRL